MVVGFKSEGVHALWLTVPFGSIYPADLLSQAQHHMCPVLFTVALTVTAKDWKAGLNIFQVGDHLNYFKKMNFWTFGQDGGIGWILSSHHA